MKNAEVAVSLLLGLLDRATTISDLIRTAQREGRDITQEELDDLAADDDVARLALEQAIKEASSS